MRTTLVAAAATVSAALAGFYYTAAAQESLGPQQGFAPSYAVNQSGMTYGSALDSNRPGNEPDLIKAIGDDNTVGYVRATDLAPDHPTTPEEALAGQQDNAGAKVIPLYGVDGITVIGTFTLAGTEQVMTSDGKG